MKIVLGSAQFGMNYGISNVHGKTNRSEVHKILLAANNSGINMIDTASSYGDSENIIGGFKDEISNWKIVTKTPYFFGDTINSKHIEILNKSFNQSLLDLRKANVYGLLLHSCDDLLKPGGELLYDEILKLKSVGLVSKIGITIYNKNQVESILDKFNIDLVQLPINMLDPTFLESSYLKTLKEKNIEIHARSVFLQGLLLMNKNLVPDYFSPIKKNLNNFYKLANELSLSQLELALAFVTNNQNIDRIVVGINKVEQLKEIIDATDVKLQNINLESISVNDKNFTNPSLWGL